MSEVLCFLMREMLRRGQLPILASIYDVMPQFPEAEKEVQ
jgi:hypothetical protein